MCNSIIFFACVQFLFVCVCVVWLPTNAILHHSNCRKLNAVLLFSVITPIVITNIFTNKTNQL